MAKITYGTKAPFQNNPDIPKENKCTADDLNEIKNVVNQNDDDLETAKANIEELQNGQGTSESNITSLKNRISALETDNTNNKSNITNLQNNKVDKIEGKGLSTEDFTTALKTKLEKLQNYDDTEIKKDIEELKTEQTEQNEEIDLIANMIPTLETEEAEELNVKSSKYYGNLDLKGNTWQENTETLSPENPSKIHNVGENINLFNKENPNVLNAYINNNSLVAEAQNRVVWLPCKANTTYTVSKKAGQRFAVGFSSQQPNIGTAIDQAKTINTETSITNTSLENSKYIVIYCANYNNSMEIEWQEILDTLKVAEGSVATPYSPYNRGNVGIEICNKNVYEDIEDGYISTATGENQASTIYKRSVGKVLLKANKQLKLIRYDSNKGIRFYYYDLDGIYIESSVNSGVSELNTNIYNKDVYLRYVLMNITSDDNVKCMLCNINSVSDYVKHEGQEITFPLEEGQKLYKGSYLGQEKIHHVRKQIEFDGTENWVKSTTKEYAFQYSLGGISLNGICTHYQSTGNANDIGTKDSIYLKYSYTAIITDLRFTDVEDFKEYLAQQKQAGTPVTIECALAEEETEEMTEQQKEVRKQLQKIMTYYPETNITNNQKALMKLTYKMNLNDAIVALQKLSIG